MKMIKQFVVPYLNKKHKTTYYALLRDVSVFGEDKQYIVYQNESGELYAREKTEFNVKFEKLDHDDRPAVVDRQIRIWAELVANSSNMLKYESDKIVMDNTLFIVSEAIIDCTNKYSNKERIFVLLYKQATEAFCLAETKFSHVVVKKSTV